MLAIADLVGGEWPEAARRALVSLCCGGQSADDSTGTLLLSDIRRIFMALETNRLSSTELSSALAEIETSPWGECNRGKPITPPKLARLLRAFNVNPHNIRTEKGVFKGYEAGDFEQVWARYLSNPAAPSRPETATPLQTNTDQDYSSFEDATRCIDVAAQDGRKPFENAPCSGVAATEIRTEIGVEEDL